MSILNPFSLHRWLTRVAGQPLFVLIVLMGLTALSAGKIPWLNFSVDVRDLIVDDVPERHHYNEFKSLFGTDEIIQVVVSSDNFFVPQSFARLSLLSDALEKIPGVSRVIGLPQVKAVVDPQDQWSVERFARLTTPVQIFQRNLISSDQRVAGITLILNDDANQDAVTQAVDDALGLLGEGYSGYQIGMPTVSIALARYAQRDVMRLPLYTVLIIALLLIVMFGQVLAVALPLICVAVACLWTIGIMAWAGVPLNLLTVVVPILQIAVGTAYCLYISYEFRRQAPVCRDARTALLNTYAKTASPTMIAVCTTIAGIASLMITPIGAVRHFSAFACLGILGTLAAVMTLYPCLLVLAWPILRKQDPRAAVWWFPSSFVNRLVHLIVHHRRTLFFVLVAFTALAIAGILRIRVETNPLAYFKDNTAISRHFHDVYRHLSGSFPLHLQARSTSEDYFLSSTGLKQLAHHQQFMETLPGVDKSLAFTDYLMLVNYVSNRFDPAYYVLPEADFEIRMLVNQFKSLLGRDVLQRYVSDDFSVANITMLTHLSSAGGFMETQKRIHGYCARHRDEDLSCRVTGFGLVMSLGSHHLIKGQVLSLLITLGIIFALIHLMFLSIKIGALAMLANLFPILVSFGAMGWLGIDLSMGTCLIASIVMGLAVDDTIHYLARYRLAYKRELDPTAAMRTTLTQVGPPIVSTSVAICAGFSILMLSSFTPTAVFGLLMALAMVSALSGGLLILPALLSKVSPITLAEIFQIRIGGDRLQKTVPLLKGMTRLQVHHILKAGEIMRIDAGSHLFDQGDVADRMYVVISGTFDAVMNESDANHNRRSKINLRVNRLKVGDVIGEMGLMTSGYRCVSVLAVASGEVLALSQAHLARIRRLHPRIASQFFANLSAILTAKLIQADQSLSHTCNVDEATGLLNREAFLDCVEKEIDRSRRFGDCAAVCLLDVTDNGDTVAARSLMAEHLIVRTARVMSSCFRTIDILGRFDDATLAVLLARTTSLNAPVICSRLQCAFNSQLHNDPLINATISCRFLDLDGTGLGNADSGSLDMIGAIELARQQNDRHLVYVSLPAASP